MPYGLPAHPILEHEAKDEAIRHIYETLDRLTTGRQAMVDALWARIPVEITEHRYVATAKTVATAPVTTQLVKVTSVVATLPTGATGTLQLGDLVIPLGQGVTNLIGLRVFLHQSDTRLLQSTKAGPVSLTLSGEVAPTIGTT